MKAGTLSLALLVVSTVQSFAQDVVAVRIAEDPTCPACTVRLSTIATLALPSSGGPAPALPSSVTLDSRGRIWVFGEGLPLVFDAAGAKLNQVRMIAGREAGFRYPSDALAVGDSVVVLDQISGVAAVFGPDLVELRETRFALPLVRAKIVRWPDFVIGVGLLPMPAAKGWPLHRVSVTADEAKVLLSFGAGNGQLRAATMEINDQRISPTETGTFWSFLPSRYRLTKWDSTLHATEILERHPAWFPDSGQAGLGSPTTPPAAAVSGLRADSTGLLWAFISVPSEIWPSAWPARRPGLAEVSSSSIAYERLYRTSIEVIDVRSKRVVTRAFTDAWVLAALSATRAVVVDTDALGNRRLSLVSLSIDRGEARPR
jgi:hypothetical protein